MTKPKKRVFKFEKTIAVKNTKPSKLEPKMKIVKKGKFIRMSKKESIDFNLLSMDDKKRVILASIKLIPGWEHMSNIEYLVEKIVDMYNNHESGNIDIPNIGLYNLIQRIFHWNWVIPISSDQRIKFNTEDETIHSQVLSKTDSKHLDHSEIITINQNEIREKLEKVGYKRQYIPSIMSIWNPKHDYDFHNIEIERAKCTRVIARLKTTKVEQEFTYRIATENESMNIIGVILFPKFSLDDHFLRSRTRIYSSLDILNEMITRDVAKKLYKKKITLKKSITDLDMLSIIGVNLISSIHKDFTKSTVILFDANKPKEHYVTKIQKEIYHIQSQLDSMIGSTYLNDKRLDISQLIKNQTDGITKSLYHLPKEVIDQVNTEFPDFLKFVMSTYKFYPFDGNRDISIQRTLYLQMQYDNGMRYYNQMKGIQFNMSELKYHELRTRVALKKKIRTSHINKSSDMDSKHDMYEFMIKSLFGSKYLKQVLRKVDSHQGNMFEILPTKDQQAIIKYIDDLEIGKEKQRLNKCPHVNTQKTLDDTMTGSPDYNRVFKNYLMKFLPKNTFDELSPEHIDLQRFIRMLTMKLKSDPFELKNLMTKFSKKTFNCILCGEFLCCFHEIILWITRVNDINITEFILETFSQKTKDDGDSIVAYFCKHCNRDLLPKEMSLQETFDEGNSDIPFFGRRIVSESKVFRADIFNILEKMKPTFNHITKNIDLSKGGFTQGIELNKNIIVDESIAHLDNIYLRIDKSTREAGIKMVKKTLQNIIVVCGKLIYLLYVLYSSSKKGKLNEKDQQHIIEKYSQIFATSMLKVFPDITTYITRLKDLKYVEKPKIIKILINSLEEQFKSENEHELKLLKQDLETDPNQSKTILEYFAEKYTNVMPDSELDIDAYPLLRIDKYKQKLDEEKFKKLSKIPELEKYQKSDIDKAGLTFAETYKLTYEYGVYLLRKYIDVTDFPLNEPNWKETYMKSTHGHDRSVEILLSSLGKQRFVSKLSFNKHYLQTDAFLKITKSAEKISSKSRKEENINVILEYFKFHCVDRFIHVIKNGICHNCGKYQTEINNPSKSTIDEYKKVYSKIQEDRKSDKTCIKSIDSKYPIYDMLNSLNIPKFMDYKKSTRGLNPIYMTSLIKEIRKHSDDKLLARLDDITNQNLSIKIGSFGLFTHRREFKLIESKNSIEKEEIRQNFKIEQYKNIQQYLRRLFEYYKLLSTKIGPYASITASNKYVYKYMEEIQEKYNIKEVGKINEYDINDILNKINLVDLKINDKITFMINLMLFIMIEIFNRNTKIISTIINFIVEFLINIILEVNLLDISKEEQEKIQQVEDLNAFLRKIKFNEIPLNKKFAEGVIFMDHKEQAAYLDPLIEEDTKISVRNLD
jgi:hypothetical protein